MTDQDIKHWRQYALGVAKKLQRSGTPFTQEDLEDCEMEGLLKALELDGHDNPYIATSVGNKVRDMAKRLRTRSRDINLENLEK